MYVGVIVAVLGQAILHHSMRVVWYLLVVAGAFHLRVLLYEEPKLRELFGADYATYCGRVRRWVPTAPRPPR